MNTMEKSRIKIILFSVLLGVVLNLSHFLYNNSEKKNVNSVPALAVTADEKVLANLIDLEQLIGLGIPQPSADIDVWLKFLSSLERFHVNGRSTAWEETGPLMAFHVYIAKYKPEIYYQRMSDSEYGSHVVSNLLRLGLLPNWYEEVKNVNSWLLNNKMAIKSLAQNYGIHRAQRVTAESFLSVQPHGVQVDLSILRFASLAMTEDELESVIDGLLTGHFNYDPRGVESLIGLSDISRKDLISLIKNNAYSDKSMSSYMATAARLGDVEYIVTMAKDADTNDGQPTNFYCSGCALSLYTDGLIGQALVRAASKGRANVHQGEDVLIITSAAFSGSVGGVQ